MSEPNEKAYYFAEFCMDAARRRLLAGETQVPLTSKAFETLLILVRHQGTTVSKSELMNTVWRDTAVEENNLTQQISALRRALGERPDDHRFIVTVPGHGYCFVAEVTRGVSEQSTAVDTARTEEMTDRKQRWIAGADPAALRGYSLAIGLISLVILSVVASAMRSAPPGRTQTLAVLGFKVLATGDEFIGDGISETLRARLGSVRDLEVRTGTFSVSDQDAVAAGRRLQVDTVVTGSIQRDHDRLRVAVEVLDVTDGRIVWGKIFDESASNLFALQDSIAGDVANALRIGSVSSRKSAKPYTSRYVPAAPYLNPSGSLRNVFA